MSLGKIFFLACLAFSGGVGIGSFFMPPLYWLLGLGCGGIILMFLTGPKLRCLALGLCLVFAGLGIFRCYLAGRVSALDISRYNDSDQVTVTGLVSAWPEERSNQTHLEIQVESVNEVAAAGKVLVASPRYPRYNYGDRIQVKGKLQTPAEFEDFSYKDYLARYGIRSVMYFAKISKLESGQGNKFLEKVFFLKNSLKESLQRSLPEPESGFAQRLLLGERKAMSAETLEAFKKTGTMHVVAISGYHVAIVVTLLTLLTRPLGRRWSGFIALGAISVYVLLTGASASVVRAALMGGLVLIALQIGRLSGIRNAVALAAAVMLAGNPWLLRYDIGFQLSFLAVIGIAYLSPSLEKIFRWVPNFLAFRDSFVITTAAMITTLPLSVFHFGRLALICPFVNFLLLPSIPLAMGLSFLVSLGGLVINFGQGLLAAPAWLTLHYGIRVVELGAQVPGAYFDTAKIGWWVLALSYAVIFSLIIWRHSKNRDN
jgi:competence protein ComEC